MTTPQQQQEFAEKLENIEKEKRPKSGEITSLDLKIFQPELERIVGLFVYDRMNQYAKQAIAKTFQESLLRLLKEQKPLETAVNFELVDKLEEVVDILYREKGQYEAQLAKLQKKFGKRLFNLFLGKMRVSVEWKREKRKADL